jgi:hypothetical protein
MIFSRNGQDCILLEEGSDDKCPICGMATKKMCFSWNIFHGEARSSCCGAPYQIKDFYIEKPTDDDKAFFDHLNGKYIWFKIPTKYIKPLKEAMKELEKTNINDKDVFSRVEEIVGD